MFKNESVYAKIIHWLVMFLFTGLFAVGVSVTGWNFLVSSETVKLRGNDMFFIFCSVLAVVFLLYLLSKLYDKAIYKIKPWIITAIFAVLAYAVSALWVLSSQAVPQADQLTVYHIAKDFNIGLQEPLTETSYIVFFPYQLGLVTILRICIKLFGYKNYVAVQLILALCSPLIVVSGSGIINYLSKKENFGKVNFFYGLACLLCLPMHLYTTFIYGDLPYAAVSMLCIWIVYSILDKPKVYKFILLFIFSGLNFLLKTNALIVVLAISIFLLINLLKKDKRLVSIIAIVVMILGTVVINKANQAIYADQMPKEYSSLPFIASVVMGMNDDGGSAGWCNFYHQTVFVDNECDPADTTVQCVADLKKIVKHWIKHPTKAINFFYRKINLQWNAPLYQGVVMNSTHKEENLPKLGELVYTSASFHMGMQIFAKVYQISLYGIIAAALWIRRKKVSELKPYILMIAIFGSFLFSLIWESKTRYQMPAFIMMIPCFALAIPVLLERIGEIKGERVTEYFSAPDYVRENHNGIDLFKFISALVVVAIHVMPQINLYNDEEFSMGLFIDKQYSYAVPFFFMAAGYMLAEKLLIAATKEEKIKVATSYLIKTVKLYVIWFAVYSPFYVYYSISNAFKPGYAVRGFLKAFVFIGNYYNAYILWYLLATIYAVIAVIIYLKLDIKVSTMVLWTIGFICLSLSWSWILTIGDPSETAAIPYGKTFVPLWSAIQKTFASGKIPGGIFYLPLGMLLVKKHFSIKTGVLAYLSGFCFIYTDILGLKTLGTILVAFGIFTIAREIKLPDSGIWKQLRRISTGVYFMHLIVWTAVYNLVYGTKTFGPLPYLLVAALSVLVTVLYYTVVDFIKKKSKKSKA